MNMELSAAIAPETEIGTPYISLLYTPPFIIKSWNAGNPVTTLAASSPLPPII